MDTRVEVGRIEVESRDLGEVEHLISSRYVRNRPRLLGRSSPLRFRSRAAWAGGVTVDRMIYGATVAVSTEAFETIVVVDVTGGRFDLTAGRYVGRAGEGGVLLYPPGIPLAVLMEQVTCDIVQMPAAAVTRLAGRLGVDSGDFRLAGVQPVSPALTRHWLATAAYLFDSFAGPDPAVSNPLILSSVVEAAAAAVLAAFPNSTMTVDYTPGAGRVPPIAVRQAVAYIDAHADGPITLEDVAAAAGVRVRGLQAAFARHGDTTPMGYLRRVRMERAHRDLLAGDRARGDTVAGIARRWGFAAPGRFAVEYRKVFGRSPGETLGA
ncbi:AraC family transcriptional regulator [Virgisporangium aurantiacum]|nr:AraC family transcriptional regulator [Virgisporangium aurantiacum]